jgi:hypothetical protein
MTKSFLNTMYPDRASAKRRKRCCGISLKRATHWDFGSGAFSRTKPNGFLALMTRRLKMLSILS